MLTVLISSIGVNIVFLGIIWLVNEQKKEANSRAFDMAKSLSELNRDFQIMKKISIDIANDRETIEKKFNREVKKANQIKTKEDFFLTMKENK